MVRNSKLNAWQLHYNTEKDGLHIGRIKPKIEHWPWATYKLRYIETAVARLRIGHSELNANMYRFNQAENPNCNRCQVPETVEHFLMSCRRFTRERQNLFTALRIKGIHNISMTTILGGDQLTPSQQAWIASALELFLRQSGRMKGTYTQVQNQH